MLAENRPVERDIAGGEAHKYQVTLNEGQFLRVIVDQQGIDAVLALFDPKGSRLFKSDSPNDTHGPESLSFIASAAGNYTLTVSAYKREALSGHYVITLKDLRTPTAQDRRRVEAERALIEGEQSRVKWKREFQQRAKDKYEEALALFKEIGDQYWEALAHEVVGSIELSWGNRQKATEHFEAARKLYNVIHDPSGEARVLNQLGEIRAVEGNNSTALTNYKRACELFQAAQNRAGQGISLGNIGSVYRVMGQHKEALAFLKDALPLLEASRNYTQQAETLRQMGVIYSESNKSEAVNCYEKALQLERKANNHLGEVITLTSLLAVARRERRAPSDTSEHVLSLARDSWGVAESSNNNWVSLDDSSNVKEDLIKPYETALSTSRAAGNPYAEANALNKMGQLMLSLGKSILARKYFNNALILYQQLEYAEGVGYSCDNLMLYWREQQNPGLAIFYGKQAVNVYQKMRGNLTAMGKESQSSFLRSRQDTYRMLADLLISEKRIIEAQQVLNLLKEEEFFQFLNEDAQEAATLMDQATYTADEANWLKQYQELLALFMAAASKDGPPAQAGEGPKGRAADGPEVDAKSAKRRLETFLDQLTREASLTAKRESTQIPESQDLINSLRELGPGVVALYTLLSKDRYSVMLVSPEGTAAEQYPIKTDELNRRVAEFKLALLNPNSDLLPLAQELYQIIVRPKIASELDRLHARTLMWSLDGVLRTIPIAALHDGKQYMVERYQLEVFTLASRAALRYKSNGQWAGAAFGVTKEHEDFEYLPAVQRELTEIIYQGDAQHAEDRIPGEIMFDDDFTEETLRRALQRRYPVVHIASHFQFDYGNALDSFLLLGDGKHFSLEQVRRSNRLFDGVELLTLSACDTATQGVGANGKEVDGFAELAQRQGAKAVIASLWPVADDSTADLMQKFYALKKQQPGMSKAEALRRAQLELMKCRDGEQNLSEEDRAMMSFLRGGGSTDCFSHPYFWAPFILIGNWR